MRVLPQSDLSIPSAFRAALAREDFMGQFEDSRGARQVAATDNSIYEVLPQGIAYPVNGHDINRIVRAAGQSGMSLTARGGNTGTNGQSLNDGIIVDCGRHLNRVLHLDLERMTVTVEPGVVLDQLNAALAPHGLFFPPMVSTASRATIGGMVSTDASGKGSRRWGKTSDYIEALTLVLSDGHDCAITGRTIAEADVIARGDDRVALIHREALRIARDHAETISAVFPTMNRGLTGYNLQKMLDGSADRFDLSYLVAGAEGTLGLIKEITLRLVRKPSHRGLVVIRYDDLDLALRDVPRLLEADPTAVEIVDDKVLGVAQSDIIWSGLEEILGAHGDRAVKAMSIAEYVGYSRHEVEQGIARLMTVLGEAQSSLIDYKPLFEPDIIARIWTLRERSVGLLARVGGGRQGIPFVEDTAVPPDCLADYVRDFRSLLDGHGLDYGMFGHADVGCLHVRPFLDMKDPDQAALIRPVSDGVAELTKRYGGLLWGEHGRGYRGEYSPLFFGDRLYPELCRLKAAFDPGNMFNPGKLAAPTDEDTVDRIDGVPLRGEMDRLIVAPLREEYDRSIACNGNGACFSWDATDPMCPSYKATRDRSQSPKGRAALLRAWARLESTETGAAEREALEQATYNSLETCLACKACTSQCPVRVDIPTMRSRFLQRYFDRYPRPAQHRFLRHVETLFAVGRRFPRVANVMGRSSFVRYGLEAWLALVDLPAFAPTGRTRKPRATRARLSRLTASERTKTVVLVEDSFTASFEGRVVTAAAQLLEALGYRVFRLPARANGKILHHLGLKAPFAHVAQARMAECRALADQGVALVGVDAATMLLFEHEYREVTDIEVAVQGLESFLSTEIDAGRIALPTPCHDQPALNLFGHCTESVLRPRALDQWVSVFAFFGLTVRPVRTGCCGMAGLFGHQAEQRKLSQELYDLSWRDNVSAAPSNGIATGYSCRSQALRMDGIQLRHPAEALLFSFNAAHPA